jgi:hypothetical protein
MSSPAREALPRPPVFNAVSAGLLLLSAAWVLLIVATPPGPTDMMVPWLRSVSLMQALIGAACVTLIWFRQGWAFYVYVGLVLLGVLLGLVLRYAIPLLLVGPVLLALYLWALHAGGTGSMWRQMFGARAGPRLWCGTGHAAAAADLCRAITTGTASSSSGRGPTRRAGSSRGPQASRRAA